MKSEIKDEKLDALVKQLLSFTVSKMANKRQGLHSEMAPKSFFDCQRKVWLAKQQNIHTSMLRH